MKRRKAFFYWINQSKVVPRVSLVLVSHFFFGKQRRGFFMKEIYQVSEHSDIVWPQGPQVVIDNQTDFAYIMRKDLNFTVDQIAQRYTGDYNKTLDQVTRVMRDEYEKFFANLAETITWGFSDKGKVQLHLYDPDYLENGIREKAGDQPMVSLDPLMDQDIMSFKVSRAYYPGGKNKYAQVERPGSESISAQASIIAESLQGQTVAIVEDDIFSGGSVIQSAQYLNQSGVQVNRTITGLLIGDPPELNEMGIEAEGVVTYEREDGGDIFDKVDLGDPRDFLIGASGLVVKLPNGELGRAPYLFPFVSPHARVSIPSEKEEFFSNLVLEANYTFFNNLDAELGEHTCIKHMDPDFAKYMYEQHGIPVGTPMVQVVEWMMDNTITIWHETEKQAEFAQNLEKLQLPQKIVFIDVNGTLIPDDSLDGYIPEGDITGLRELIEKLDQHGIKVGLCSDSPLPQLIEYSESLGLNGPIIAENGNIIYYHNEKVVVSGVDHLDEVKGQVKEIAQNNDFMQEEDVIAQEFGGKVVTDTDYTWAFGANRETSVTLFGHSAIMQTIASEFSHEGLTIDASPESPNSLAVHNHDYRKLKSQAIALLTKYGYSSLLVGNSYSDWVVNNGNSQTAFVANASVTEQTKNQAIYTAEKSYAAGVVEILRMIYEGYN